MNDIKNIALASDNHYGLMIECADGIFIYDRDGKSYMDLISGISVNNLGHKHPAVIDAIKEQLEKHTHIMVYGQHIQSAQVKLSVELTKNLPGKLNCCFFVNSGTEAVEGALKLALLFTGRKEVVSFKGAYHGSTIGALNVLGNDVFRKDFFPLVHGSKLIEFNNFRDLESITENTACVIAETVQGEGGVIVPENGYLESLRKKCDEVGTLLILDEVQTGFGRTGALFAFEHYNIVPDIITIAKGMGGGMPVGAFISSREIMDSLDSCAIPGHMTTFGGHPVSCAAALATLSTLLNEGIIKEVEAKGKLFKKLLSHKIIKEIRGIGLMMAMEFENPAVAQKVMKICLDKGVILDQFLFAGNCLRIAPPLIISDDEIERACKIILSAIDEM